jgi:hypothetical protein
MASYLETVTAMPGVVSYWTLDQESGNFTDSIGTNHIAEGGTVTRGQPPLIEDDGFSVLIGANGSLQSPPSSDWNFGTDQIWFCGWFLKPSGAALEVMAGWHGNSWVGFNEGKLYVKFYVQGSGTALVDDSQRHFFFYYKNGVDVKVWLDGTEAPDFSASIIDSGVDLSSNPFTISGLGGEYLITGTRVDSFAIGKGFPVTWNQVKALYDAGITEEVRPPPPPPPSLSRPMMRMIPFAPMMYPDDVVFWRVTKASSGQGGTSNTYPGDGIPMVGNVQSKRVDRSMQGGKTTSVTIHTVTTPSDIQAKPDDKFVWMGRTLLVEAGTIPKGTGNVTFHTPCVETK